MRHAMKSRSATLWIAGVGISFVCVACVAGTLSLARELLMIPPLLTESRSPAGWGTAAFVRLSGFNASHVDFYVRDPAKGLARAVYVGGGYGSDGGVKMSRAIWSRDGSLVAIRARVGEPRGHGFSKYYGKFFVVAYDFRKNSAVGVGLPLRQKSRVIHGLLRQRGGEGQAALAEPYGSGEPIDRSDAEREFKETFDDR